VLNENQIQFDCRISKWVAEFSDPATEKAYRSRNAGPMIRQTRFGIGLWAFLLILFIHNDYAYLATSQGFWILLGMRVTVGLAILIFSLRIGRNPDLVMNGWGTAGLLIFGWTGFFLIFFFMPTEQFPWIIAMVMAMLMSQYVFIPNRVSTGTVTAVYAIAGTLVSIYAVAGTETEKLIDLGFVLLVPAATGLFVCHRFQSEHRRVFAMLLTAESANSRLEKEIELRRELEADLKRQAATDPLTGLYNRRRYEALFLQELRRIRRNGGELSLLILDLDHFKQVNDTLGHSAGDVALKEVSDLCRSHLRDIDIIGRLGGEEFVIILPDTSMDAAVIVANRLRLAIENTKIVFKENIFRLTVTIGVAGLTQKDRDIDSLVHRADAALYKGKQAGRNRVEVSGPVQADMI